LEERTQHRLREHVDALIAESGKGWYPGSEHPEERGALFVPYPKEDSDTCLLQEILSVLDQKITRLRESGHCTIFTALALKALHYLPSMITSSVVGGICRLIALFGDSPGKVYSGTEKRWVEGVPVEPDNHVLPYQDTEGLVCAAFTELIRDDKILRAGYGGLVHLITHTNALVELAELGYGELARKGYRAHQTQILSMRSAPPYRDENDTVVVLQPTKESPLTYEYWQQFDPNGVRLSALRRGGIDHALKVSYAFFHIIKYVRDPEMREQCLQQLGYLT
jgi:hypothetical protein